MVLRLRTLDLAEFTDGNAEQRAFFAAELGRALHEDGYFVLRGNPIAPALLERGYALTKKLFELPEPVRRTLTVDASGGMIGYVLGDSNEQYGRGEAPTELWHFGREFPENEPLARSYYRNRWPAVEGFRDTCLALYASMEHLARGVLEAYTLFLLGSIEHGNTLAKQHWSVFRMMRYPPWTAERPKDTFRASAHVDVTLLSIYTGGSHEGLEFLTQNGTWEPVTPNSNAILVGAGEVFELMSLGLVRPTMHRVVYPEGTPTERFAMPFFVLPNPETRLDQFASAAKAHGGTLAPSSLTVGQLVARRAGWGEDAATQPREHRSERR